VWNTQTDAYATELQKKSPILLKNSGNTIAQSDGTKKTVYVPYAFDKGSEASSSGDATPRAGSPSLT
jgi:hypothetical protein